MGYRVKTVSALTGIPRGTLLAWERRYDILSPDRSPSGYREYSEADVAVFRRLKSLVDEGYTISEAVALTRGGRAAAPAVPAEVGGAPTRDGPPRDVVEDMLAALLAFDRAAADKLVPRFGQVSLLSAVDELFVPVLHRLGEAWARGEITIAQEHFVSGFCREHLLAMYHGLGGGPETGLTVACATPPGERHELGLLVLAFKLALAGHRVVWLGADLPVPDLCAYLITHQPRLLCLSFTRTTSAEEVTRFVGAIRAGCTAPVEIVLGGPGLHGLDLPLLDGARIVGTFAALEVLLAQVGTTSRARGGSARVPG